MRAPGLAHLWGPPSVDGLSLQSRWCFLFATRQPDSRLPLLPHSGFSQQIQPPTQGFLARLPSVASLLGIPCFTAAWQACNRGSPGGGGCCAQKQLIAVQVMVWNLDTKESVIMSPVRTITCHQGVILSMSFNTNGSLLATTCKDRKLRILDPRAGTVLQVCAGLGSGLGAEEQGVVRACGRLVMLWALWPSLHMCYLSVLLALLGGGMCPLHSLDEKTEVKERSGDLPTLKAEF